VLVILCCMLIYLYTKQVSRGNDYIVHYNVKSVFLFVQCCAVGIVCVIDRVPHVNIVAHHTTQPRARLHCKLQCEVDCFIVVMLCCWDSLCY
jgi:hypothetical protein